jgi:GGDEF domain-containing protein
MNDIFDVWCNDPRTLTFAEFLDDLWAQWEVCWRRDGLGFLDERYRRWEGLPRGSAIEEQFVNIYSECRRRIGLGQTYAVCFADIDGLDEYGKRYGADRCQELVAAVERILHNVVNRCHSSGLEAYVGGNSFILVILASDLGVVCSQICDSFDRLPGVYDQTESKTISSSQKPLSHQATKLSIGVVTNETRKLVHFSQIAELAMEMLGYAKAQPGSVFVVDRRRDSL